MVFSIFVPAEPRWPIINILPFYLRYPAFATLVEVYLNAIIGAKIWLISTKF